LTKTNNVNVIKSLILQITCVIIELSTIYNIYHGDINSGNILIDSTNERTLDYYIEGEKYNIESYGIIPKIIDFGRSYFYKEDENMSNHKMYKVWYDIVMTLGIIYPYIQNIELKQKVYKISGKLDMSSPSLKHYYLYVRDNL
jgi:serine/threonine protein kinase